MKREESPDLLIGLSNDELATTIGGTIEPPAGDSWTLDPVIGQVSDINNPTPLPIPPFLPKPNP
jgi:hypothetical protein